MFAVFIGTAHSWYVMKPRFESQEQAIVHALDLKAQASYIGLAGMQEYHIVNLSLQKTVSVVSKHGFKPSNLDVSNHIQRWGIV